MPNNSSKMSFEMEEIQVIELRMMDKRKYYPLTLASGISIRSILYPFMLIKTRLQIQRGNTLYKGTFDAFMKITRREGVTGLYRGFWVSCLQLFPSMFYITSYEWIRHYFTTKAKITDTRLLSFTSGGVASIVGQTLSVPLDIVTQHLMLMGRRVEGEERVQQKLSVLQTLRISEEARLSRFGAVSAVIRAVYQQDGVMGFYKGYVISLLCFAPHSALWWFFYDIYSAGLTAVLPVWMPRLALRVMAAPLGGISAAILTNPLDVIRARRQVEGRPLPETVRILWQEEGIWMATKGLSARLVQSITFSFFIMLGYETIKRWSLLEDYKDKVRW